MEQTQTKDQHWKTDPNSVFLSLHILSSCDDIAINACSTENCSNNAFMCINQNCKCQAVHQNCSNRTKVQQLTNNIGTHKKQVPINITTLFDDIIQQYDNMIEKLSQDRLQFVQYTNYFGLSQKTIEAMKYINEGNFDNITGNDINQICQQMNTEVKIHSPSKMTSIKYLQDCQKQIHVLLKKLDYQINALVDERIKMAVSKFGQRNLNIQSLKRQDMLWEFIPIQIANFSKLKKLSLRKNKIRRINNLQSLILLQQLDLDHNHISRIENLEILTNLRQLCLTRNRITKIENLECLTNLTNLQLNSNEIIKIENLDNLIQLTYLDLRDNLIIKIQNLDSLVNIGQLLLDQNKIMKVENLFHLNKLKLLSLRQNPMEPNEQNIAVLKELKKRGLDSLYLPQ